MRVIADFLCEDVKSFYEDQVVFNQNFPLFLQDSCLVGDGNAFLVNPIVKRPESLQDGENQITSEHLYHLVIVTLRDLLKKSDDYSGDVVIHRAAINVTFNNGGIESGWHDDHAHDYEHAIIYLNDADEHSCTVLKIDNKEYRFAPKKWSCLLFDKCTHKSIFPRFGVRYALIITFSKVA
jgi:hypothetical protein